MCSYKALLFKIIIVIATLITISNKLLKLSIFNSAFKRKFLRTSKIDDQYFLFLFIILKIMQVVNERLI